MPKPCSLNFPPRLLKAQPPPRMTMGPRPRAPRRSRRSAPNLATKNRKCFPAAASGHLRLGPLSARTIFPDHWMAGPPVHGRGAQRFLSNAAQRAAAPSRQPYTQKSGRSRVTETAHATCLTTSARRRPRTLRRGVSVSCPNLSRPSGRGGFRCSRWAAVSSPCAAARVGSPPPRATAKDATTVRPTRTACRGPTARRRAARTKGRTSAEQLSPPAGAATRRPQPLEWRRRTLRRTAKRNTATTAGSADHRDAHPEPMTRATSHAMRSLICCRLMPSSSTRCRSRSARTVARRVCATHPALWPRSGSRRLVRRR